MVPVYTGRNNVFSHDTSCVPIDPFFFFFLYFFTGIGALLTTAIALAIIVGGIALIGLCIYGVYLLVSGCCECCNDNYKLAKQDAKAHKATEKAPLMQVNVETK